MLRTPALKWIIPIISVLMVAGCDSRSDEAHPDQVRTRNYRATPGQINEVRSRLRSLESALIVYESENHRLPSSLFSLTTPVAYYDGDLGDPFRTPIDGEVEPPLSFAIDLEAQVVRIYSVGLDAVDDKGLKASPDERKSFAEGDLVHEFTFAMEYLFMDRPEFNQVRETRLAVTRLRDLVSCWTMAHGGFPASLNTLVEDGYSAAIPTDPWNDGHPISARVMEDGKTLILFSRGPDGDDDDARPIVFRTLPDGDICERLDLGTILEARRPFAGTLGRIGTDEYYTKLLRLRDETGRDNALIRFSEACGLMPELPPPAVKEAIDQVLRQGWPGEGLPLLDDHLELWREAFARIEEGTRVEEAYGIGGKLGYHSPEPQFLHLQSGAKYLLVDGNRLLSAGESEGALQRHLVVLAMASDLEAEGNSLIGCLVGIKIINDSVPSLHRLIRSGILDREQYMQLQSTLMRIDEHPSYVVGGMRTEQEMNRVAVMAIVSEMRDSLSSNADAEAAMKELAISAGYRSDDLLSEMEKELDAYCKSWQASLDWLDQPTHLRSLDKWTEVYSQIVSPSQLFSIATPNGLEAITREDNMRASLRLLCVEAALALHHLDNGRYPEDLDSLKPVYMPEPILDPFSGEPFIYIPASDGLGYELRSIGPDRVADESPIPYDPTNGTLSSGDIFFQPATSPEAP